jgi:hypothetical protein
MSLSLVPERTWCSAPMYDEDGTTLTGSCGRYLQGDPASVRAYAGSLGWQLEPEPCCPGHHLPPAPTTTSQGGPER